MKRSSVSLSGKCKSKPLWDTISHLLRWLFSERHMLARMCRKRNLVHCLWECKLFSQFNRSVMSDSCNLMDCSTPGLPVYHQLPEFTHTHVHWVIDATESSHPLSSPFPPTFNLSQHQRLFQWVSSLHQVTKVLGVSASASVLPMNTQDWSPLAWTGWISLQSKGLPRVFSNTTVQKHQFFFTQPSSQLNSHIHTWPLEKPWPWLDGRLLAK